MGADTETIGSGHKCRGSDSGHAIMGPGPDLLHWSDLGHLDRGGGGVLIIREVDTLDLLVGSSCRLGDDLGSSFSRRSDCDLTSRNSCPDSCQLLRRQLGGWGSHSVLSSWTLSLRRSGDCRDCLPDEAIDHGGCLHQTVIIWTRLDWSDPHLTIGSDGGGSIVPDDNCLGGLGGDPGPDSSSGPRQLSLLLEPLLLLRHHLQTYTPGDLNRRHLKLKPVMYCVHVYLACVLH